MASIRNNLAPGSAVRRITRSGSSPSTRDAQSRILSVVRHRLEQLRRKQSLRVRYGPWCRACHQNRLAASSICALRSHFTTTQEKDAPMQKVLVWLAENPHIGNAALTIASENPSFCLNCVARYKDL